MALDEDGLWIVVVKGAGEDWALLIVEGADERASCEDCCALELLLMG